MPIITIDDEIKFELSRWGATHHLLKSEKFELLFKKISHLSLSINPNEKDSIIELIFHADGVELILVFNEMIAITDVMALFNKLLELLNQN